MTMPMSPTVAPFAGPGPGSRVVIRDEEWLVIRTDPTADGGFLLTCDGVSELVRGRSALLLGELPGPRARFDANTRAHHHFTCLRCGRIADVEASVSSARLNWTLTCGHASALQRSCSITRRTRLMRSQGCQRRASGPFTLPIASA